VFRQCAANPGNQAPLSFKLLRKETAVKYVLL
jgi:hypothetical protein